MNNEILRPTTKVAVAQESATLYLTAENVTGETPEIKSVSGVFEDTRFNNPSPLSTSETVLTALPAQIEIVEISSDQIGVYFFIFNIGYDSKGKTIIEFGGQLYRDGVLKQLEKMGYYKRVRDERSFLLIHQDSRIIAEVTPANMKDDFFFTNLPETKDSLHVHYKGATCTVSIELQRETFLSQYAIVFNQPFLEHLPTHTNPVLRDDRNHSYFPFQNLITITSASGIETMEYNDLGEYCVWRDQIIQRNFILTDSFDDCHFARFIHNVAGAKAGKLPAFHSAIGYLLNNYNLPSRGQVVVCYDEKPSKIEEPSGGTGKGLFSNAIKQLRVVLKVDGKKIRKDDRFRFQGVTLSTQVFWLDDVHKDFPFEVLHSVSTDGWSIEKKFKDEFFIPAEKGPKILMCSNIILAGGGSTNKRRQFILEFSDYYSQHIVTGSEEPIKDEHGCIFFDNDYWNAVEWSKFDSFMINCSVSYFKNGLRPYTQVGQESSRLLNLTDETFVEWVAESIQELSKEYDCKHLFEEYCAYGGESEGFHNTREFNRWLEIYAETKGFVIKKRKSNGRRLISFHQVK